MQIYETPLRLVKSETMSEAADKSTYAFFETAANRKIIHDLNESGAKAWLFPPLETTKIDLTETETTYFTNLNQFDWLIFTDVCAVDYFLETLEDYAIDFYDLDDLRVCALGETVSDRLRFASVHADVIPAKIFASETFSALLDYIGETEIGSLRFLYLTGDSESDDLAEKLRTRNAEVVELPIYRIAANESSELVKLKTLLKGGAVDEFVLTAPTDLLWLKHYFKRENLADVFAEMTISAADGVMRQAAKEYDFPRVGLFQPSKVGKVI